MTIIFPLDERELIRGCAQHKSAGLGCAVDYRANYVQLYAPVSGLVYLFSEHDGGDWIGIVDAMGRKWEMAHLSKRDVQSGQFVVAGQKIGTTGNSGALTTGPHLHLQVIQGYPNRIDPQPLLDNSPLPMAYDTSNINKEQGTLVRIGTSPLRYGYILRGKRYEYPQKDEVLALIMPLEKFNIVPVLRLTPIEWETIPKSIGIKF